MKTALKISLGLMAACVSLEASASSGGVSYSNEPTFKCEASVNGNYWDVPMTDSISYRSQGRRNQRENYWANDERYGVIVYFHGTGDRMSPRALDVSVIKYLENPFSESIYYGSLTDTKDPLQLTESGFFVRARDFKGGGEIEVKCLFSDRARNSTGTPVHSL